MYIAERDAYAGNAPGCFYWLVGITWVASTSAAFWLGESLRQAIVGLISPDAMNLPRALSIEGRVEAAGELQIIPQLVGGLVLGLVLGIAQGAVLFRFLKQAGVLEWLVATAVGRTLGWIAIYIVSREMVRIVVDKGPTGSLVLFVIMAGVGAVAGLALGYMQGIVLRRRVNHPTWWVLANIPGFVAVGVLTMAALYIETESTVRDATTPIVGVITGISTAIALMELLRHPTEQAEWAGMFKDRKPKKEPPPPDTVLGSTMYERKDKDEIRS